MVDLTNATVAQFLRATVKDAQNEEGSVERMDRGENPWPEDWRALKDMMQDDRLIEWLTAFTADAIQRCKVDGVHGASVSAVLLRAVAVGYYMANVQMADELESVGRDVC